MRVADLQPGDVRTNFVMQISDADALCKVDVAGGELVLDPEDVVTLLAALYALQSKSHYGVLELWILAINCLASLRVCHA